jgi:hypothetical protein
MPMHHPLKEVFTRTAYRVRLASGGCATIRVGESLPTALLALLPGTDSPWGFITACNPHGQTRPHTFNRRAMRALYRTLRTHVPETCLHGGCGVLGKWREPSLFVTGADFGMLDELMLHFNQLCFVRGRGSEPAALRWSPGLQHVDSR